MRRFQERPNIRQARIDEHNAVSGCVEAAYSKYVERIGKKPAPMLADYASSILEGTVYVTLNRSGVAGILVLKGESDSMLIENLAVYPAYQGCGLGRSLMEFTEECATHSGLSEVRLYTHELMTENISFYHKLGFEETGRRTENGYRRVFMHKALQR